MRSEPVDCPPDAPPETECRARTGTGLFQGLGGVSVTYLWSFGPGSPSCPSSSREATRDNRPDCRRLGKASSASRSRKERTASIRHRRNPWATSPRTSRSSGEPVSTKRRPGAVRSNVLLAPGLDRTETWTGTLVAPAVEFDVTPPTLSGATPRTVRAPKGARSVRVRYKVTASDNADSHVPVTCTPRSGSRFPIGRTVVRCSATDSSANTANASFRVTVRPTR